MVLHVKMSDAEIYRKIKNNIIRLAGNKKLKIYGKLSCNSGKRMKKENRVFFRSENEAIKKGFRPCGHCLKKQYKNWNGSIQ